MSEFESRGLEVYKSKSQHMCLDTFSGKVLTQVRRCNSAARFESPMF